jgi:hypothetical protein
MLDKIITIYAIVDDLLKAIGHTEDIRCQMSDAEIITTALVGSIFFGGNHSQACNYMKDHKLIVKMLQKSRFNRRLHRLLRIRLQVWNTQEFRRLPPVNIPKLINHMTIVIS